MGCGQNVRINAADKKHQERLTGDSQVVAQFRTADDALWITDTKDMKWARVSAPPVGGKDEESVVLESGKLVAHGTYHFALEGRNEDSEPGVGLCSLMFLPEVMDDTVYIILRANTKVKDFTLVKPVTQVRYQIMNPK